MLAIEHVERCSLSLLSSMSSAARLACCRACRTLLACQVVEHAGSRASCYMLCRRLYTTLFRARLVTNKFGFSQLVYINVETISIY